MKRSDMMFSKWSLWSGKSAEICSMLSNGRHLKFYIALYAASIFYEMVTRKSSRREFRDEVFQFESVRYERHH